MTMRPKLGEAIEFGGELYFVSTSGSTGMEDYDDGTDSIVN